MTRSRTVAVATGIGYGKSCEKLMKLIFCRPTYEAMRMAIDNLKVRPDIC